MPKEKAITTKGNAKKKDKDKKPELSVLTEDQAKALEAEMKNEKPDICPVLVEDEENEGAFRLCGDTKEEIIANEKALAKVLGLNDSGLTHRFLNQMTNTFPEKGAVNTGVKDVSNDALVLVHNIKPKDAIEAMAATQMIGIHNLTMDLMRRANHASMIDHKNLYLNGANKLSRTFAALLEALGKYRGKGQQKIVVEHIHIYEGGQANIANVQNPDGDKE